MGRSSASSAGFTLSPGIITTVEILDGTIIREDMTIPPKSFIVASEGGDYTTIQEAIDALGVGNPGSINISAETYTLTTALVIHSGVQLIGCGRGSTILVFDDSVDGKNMIENDDFVSGCIDIIIRDLELDGNKANTTGTCHGIYMEGVGMNNHLYENLYIHDFDDDGIVVEDLQYCTIRNNEIKDNTDYGVRLTGNPIYSLIQGNTFRSNGSFAIAFSSTGSYNRIADNYLFGNSILLNNAGTNNIVSGNTIYLGGIIAAGRSGVYTGNFVTNTIGDLINLQNHSNADDNYIGGNTLYGTISAVYGIDIAGANCDRTVIGPNSIKVPTAGNEIRDLGTDTKFVTERQIGSSTTPIPIIYADGLTATNTYAAVIEASTRIGSSTVPVPDAHVTNMNVDGLTINVSSNFNGTAITIDNTQDIQTALDTVGSNGTVMLGIGTWTIDAAILPPSGSTLIGMGEGSIIKFVDNLSANWYIIGMEGNVTNVTIKNLVLDGNKANVAKNNSGIRIRPGSSDCLISEVTIKDISQNGSLGYGIYLEDADNCRIESCVIKDCEGEGIYADKTTTDPSYNVIIGNIISGCTYGIRFDGAGLYTTIVGNVISNSTLDGIYIGTSATSLYSTITGNTCEGNGSAGILVNANNNTITGNTCEGNVEGIDVDAAAYNVVSGNMCVGNSDDGIKVWEANADDNLIVGNTCTGNTNYGVSIETGTCEDNVVIGNLLTGNSGGAINDSGARTVFIQQEYIGSATTPIPLIYADGITSNTIITTQPIRAASSIYHHEYHMGASEASPGNSGATATVLNAVFTYLLNATNEYVYYCVDMHDDWDAVSNVEIKVTGYLANAEDANDLVRMEVRCDYGTNGDVADSYKTQTLTQDYNIGSGNAQYTSHTLIFNLVWDEGGNVLEIGDGLNIRVRLDDVTTAPVVTGFNLKHVHITYNTDRVQLEA